MEQPIIQNMSPVASQQKPPRKQLAWWMFALGFLVIIALGIIVNAVWVEYFSPAAQNAKQMEKQYAVYEEQQKAYEDAMKADTYGGKTPQETLDMFISALEKGDVDLASKYFIYNTNEMDKNYMTKNEWLDGLNKAKEEGRIQEIISKIKEVKPSERNIGSEDLKEFVILEIDNTIVDYSILLKFNKYSQIWKIESL